MKSKIFLNIDMILSILSYLTPIDLLQTSLIDKIFKRSSDLLYDRETWISIKYLTYNIRNDLTNKKKSVIMWKGSQPKSTTELKISSPSSTSSSTSNYLQDSSPGLVIYGGCFNSLNTQTCHFSFKDDTNYLNIKKVSQGNLPLKLGASASTTDSFGNVLIIGGWNEQTEDVSDSIYILDRKNINEGFSLKSTFTHKKCFISSCTTLDTGIFASGGSISPYRGSVVTSSSQICRNYDPSIDFDLIWENLPDMKSRRCGHNAVTLFDGNICCIGGYEGGTNYLNSCEKFDFGSETWINLTPMHEKRSGLATGIGPYGSIYCCGGSSDGTIGLSSLERLDIREKQWEKLDNMSKRRGYTTGCIGNRTCFYVSGGLDSNYKKMSSIECYDFIAGKWMPLSEFEINMNSEVEDNISIFSETISYLSRASHHMSYIF